jgi:hypothetical protein
MASAVVVNTLMEATILVNKNMALALVLRQITAILDGPISVASVWEAVVQITAAFDTKK